jgi:hypothetical protein
MELVFKSVLVKLAIRKLVVKFDLSFLLVDVSPQDDCIVASGL